jgi:hypothetical protein
LLAKPKGIREYLENELRALMTDKPIWPMERCGRAAILLWLISNPSLCGVRFRHKHEPANFKTTGIQLHRIARPTE